MGILKKSILILISALGLVFVSVFTLSFLSDHHKIIIHGIGKDYGLASGAIGAIILLVFFLVNLALCFLVYNRSTNKIWLYLGLLLIANIFVIAVTSNYKIRPGNYIFSDPITEAQCQDFAQNVWGTTGYGFDQSYKCNGIYWDKNDPTAGLVSIPVCETTQYHVGGWFSRDKEFSFSDTHYIEVIDADSGNAVHKIAGNNILGDNGFIFNFTNNHKYIFRDSVTSKSTVPALLNKNLGPFTLVSNQNSIELKSDQQDSAQ